MQNVSYPSSSKLLGTDQYIRVVGPQHITTLLAALRTNTFVKHFLLGNNLIGPRGARALADFIKDHPNKIETWYLAGCCIDAPSFRLFVDQIINSSVCHSIWLKRNAFTSAAADDMGRMIIRMSGLKTLDLEQTQLGDAGAARLFNLLSAHITSNGHPLSLETIYLNADGISFKGCTAVARYLKLSNCALSNLFMACNPIGDKGAYALAGGLITNNSLLRLSLKSCGLKTAGATALFSALRNHPKLSVLDVGHAYTTEDLSVRYNYIEDGATESIIDMLTHLRTLRAFTLGITAMSRESLDSIKPALRSSNLFYYMGSSIHISPNSPRALVKSDGVHDSIVRNVKAHYRQDMCYPEFLEGPLRFLLNGEHVRYIDSVYRNRDAGKAKRGEMVLQKKWVDGDSTLMAVSRSQTTIPENGRQSTHFNCTLPVMEVQSVG
jgi:NLR family CARD domain-containing protein 3